MSKTITYNTLCKGWSDTAKESAYEIVPIIIDLINIKSVVDIGCGSGGWLSVFQSFGVQDILGVDGEYLRKDFLLIPEDKFIPFDLKNPLQLKKKFDLVLCLEVAEHLPIEFSKTLIDNLTRLGPVILFSAAIPFQGGINHFNEQWPDYWADLFKENGFLPIDCIRTKVWSNKKVNWVYAQNCLLYAEKKVIEDNDRLLVEYQMNNRNNLSIVHPAKYLQEADPETMSFFKTLRKMRKIFVNAIKRRIY